MKHIFLLTAILLSIATNTFAAAWTGSTSEPENMKKIDGKPFYEITNADELAWFAEQVNSGKTTINAVLANDIVFGEDTNSFSTEPWITIKEFGGVFDGNGHTLYGVNLGYHEKDDYRKIYYHFLDTLIVGGTLKNLKLKNWFCSSKYIAYGFINFSKGTVINVVNYSQMRGAGIVQTNDGMVSLCTNFGEITVAEEKGSGGIARENLVNGIIEYCNNYGIIRNDYKTVCSYTTSKWCYQSSGGIVNYNYGMISFCISHGIITNSQNSSYGSIANYNDYDTGFISYCISNDSGSSYGFTTNGISGVKSSYYIPQNYILNGTSVSSTAEKMQTDQFAWILNTSNGTEENSGVWSRGTDGYPTFANNDSLAIRKIVFDDDGTTSNRYTNYKGLVTFPEDPEPAEGYIFIGWYNADGIKVKPTTVFTADQTVNAVYMDASDVYWTINFYNAAPADTLLETKSYQHGSIVTYGGAVPTLAATAKYTYTFKGWDVEPTNAVEDFDYHAVYDSTIRSYTITFNNSDGSKIESATFEYGKMPSCSKTPTRTATVEWKYTHKGWKPALDYVTEDASYTAIYDSVKVEYKVTFMNGVDAIDEQMVPYGDAAVAPTNVTREGYKFVGWNTSFAKITGNLTVKALFEELIIRTVSVVNSDGEKIVDQKIEDGEKYKLPDAPKKDGYTFDAYYEGDKKVGVAGDEIVVSGNVTIIAKYIKNPESSSSVAQSSSSVVKSSSSVVVSSSSVVKSSSSSKIASSSSIKPSSSSVKVVSSSSMVKSSSSTKASSSSAVKHSSSSKAKSSSSSVKSSSSKKTDALVVTAVSKFSVMALGRNVQIANAKIGVDYALFDMQGKVLMQSQVLSANFNVFVPRSGNYLLRIGDRTQRVIVK